MWHLISGLPLTASTVVGSLLALPGLTLAGEPRALFTCDGPTVVQSTAAGPSTQHIFVGSSLGGGGPDKLVKGAPYFAIGTTQTVQTTADGNRITHTNTMRYFRDNNGRIRIEYSLSAVGPFTLDQGKSVIIIKDPSTEQEYVLHPELKRADLLHVETRPATGPMLQSFTLRGPGDGGGTSAAVLGVTAGATTCGGPSSGADEAQASTVSLGERTIEGLRVTGTRVERSIPAGEIGNELPISTSSEQWVSQELGIILSRTQHDPLIGDTSFRLEQIRRAEPDPTLFKVPSDYVVQSVDAPVFLQSPSTAATPVK